MSTLLSVDCKAAVVGRHYCTPHPTMLASHHCLPLSKSNLALPVAHAPQSAGRRRFSCKKMQPVQATIAAERPASVQRPDKNGRFGKFGGKYVPETLIPALLELEQEYERARNDPAFQVCCRCAHHIAAAAAQPTLGGA